MRRSRERPPLSSASQPKPSTVHAARDGGAKQATDFNKGTWKRKDIKSTRWGGHWCRGALRRTLARPLCHIDPRRKSR